MRKRLAATAFLLAFAAAVSFAHDARAEAVEFFKCKLADGATIAQLVELANNFEGVAAENGLEGINVAFLTPLYSSDLSEGTFWWVGMAPNYAGAGQINDIWDSDAGEPTRDRWDELVSSCENSSLYRLTMTPGPDDEE